MTTAISEAGVDTASELGRLIGGVVRRDAQALARLYDLTVDRVFSVAMRVLGNGHDAEEVVCDVYQQVWNRAANYAAERGGVLRWLSVIAYTRAIDLKRRQSDRKLTDSLHPDDGESTYAESEERPVVDLIDAMAVGGAIHAALAELSTQQRELVRLAFLEGFSHQQIAERLGMPLGTVKSHIRRGLALMREMLEQRGFNA